MCLLAKEEFYLAKLEGLEDSCFQQNEVIKRQAEDASSRRHQSLEHQKEVEGLLEAQRSKASSLEGLAQELRRKLFRERECFRQLEALVAAKNACIEASETQRRHLEGMVETLQGLSTHDEEARRLHNGLNKARTKLSKANAACRKLGVDEP